MTTTTEHELEAERLKLREALRFAFEYPQALIHNRGFRAEVARLLGEPNPDDPDTVLATSEESLPPLD